MRSNETNLHSGLVMLACVLFFMGVVMAGPWAWASPNPAGVWGNRFISAGLFCWCASTLV